MNVYSNVTTIAALIGEPTRTAILMALADGRALPAGELARMAHVSPQTASNHLAKLGEGGLLAVEAWGRHRYYRLANPDVARALEAIAFIAPPAPVRSLRQSDQIKALRYARTCYDHIAGKWGVAFSRALVNKGYIEETDGGYLLCSNGETWLREFGLQEAIIRKAQPLIPWHNDWTERVHHIAGSMAVAITKRMFELGWISHGPVRRSIVVTDVGLEALRTEFGFTANGG